MEVLLQPQTDKPTVQLLGHELHAFYVINACRRGLTETGKPKDEIDAIMKLWMHDHSYEQVLVLAAEYFNIT